MGKKICVFVLLTALFLCLLTACGKVDDKPNDKPGAEQNDNGTSSRTVEDGTIESETDTSITEEEEQAIVEKVKGNFSVSGKVTQVGSVYTITEAGEYVVQGTAEDAQIVVDAPDCEVNIRLSGTSLTCTTDSPILILDADKVKLTAEKDTENIIKDARSLQTDENDTTGSGCVYAKCDLTVNGKGLLIVQASYNNGIHTTKDLTIKNLTLKATAPNNALKGNDTVTVESGEIVAVSTGGDGIKTEDSDISTKGNQRGTVDILGGKITVYAACDGIDSSYDVNVAEGAELSVYTDAYSSYTGKVVTHAASTLQLKMRSALYSSSYRYAIYFYNTDTDCTWENARYTGTQNVSSGGGMWNMGGPIGMRTTSYAFYEVSLPKGYQNMTIYKFLATQSENSLETYAAKSSGCTVNTSKDTFLLSGVSSSITGDWTTSSSTGEYSTKGIKADNAILITGGNIIVKSTDDALHANGGEILENDIESLGNVTIQNGTLLLYSSDDAVHADRYLKIEGGTITVAKSYEGLEGNAIEISGGDITVSADDDGINAGSIGLLNRPYILVSGGRVDVTVGTGDVDGIDSNGNYTQTGGFVVTRDGTNDNSGNAAALDIDGTCSITGGTFISLGTVSRELSTTLCYKQFGGSSMGGGFRGYGFGGGTSATVSFSAGTYTVTGTDITFETKTSYNGLWICSDRFTKGTTYTVSNGTTSQTWTQS